MIKAAGKTGQNVPLLYLALDADNVANLVEGKPILIHSHVTVSLGFQPMVIVIDYGTADEDVREKLKTYNITLHE
jgi:hypothetical protein